MEKAHPVVLALNGGSSSIRFGSALERRLHGKLDRIGLAHPRLSFSDAQGERNEFDCSAAIDPPSAAKVLLEWFDRQELFETISAVGHRVVRGMGRMEPEIVTQGLMDDLRRIEWIDPDHLPGEIELIDALRLHAPALPQVACFDTAFHRRMPRVARLMAVPRRLEAKGVQRYGFHGLSYAYLMEELARSAGAAAVQGRVILAHLGNGASMAASRCEIQVSYAIGVAEPTSITVETFGTGMVSRERLTQLVRKHFDLTPYGLRQMLDLVRPIYEKTASYGHFGREEPEFTWEKTDRAAALRDSAGPATVKKAAKKKALAPA